MRTPLFYLGGVDCMLEEVGGWEDQGVMWWARGCGGSGTGVMVLLCRLNGFGRTKRDQSSRRRRDSVGELLR